MLYFSCVPFDQSKSGFCDPKFDFPFNLRLQSERSTFALGSFRLVSQSGFRFLFYLTKLLFDRRERARLSINKAGQG